MRVFTEGLAVELRGTGVTATSLNPGFVHTEFHERGEIDMTAYPEIAWLNAEDVVATALADVRRGAVLSTQISERALPAHDDPEAFGKQRPCIEPVPRLVDFGGDP